MKTFKPSPKSRFVIWAMLSILQILIAIAAIFFYSLAPFAITISAIVLTILIMLAAILLPIFINSFKISVENHQILIAYGIIIKRKIVINSHHIIYFTQIKSPFCAIFGLRTVKICVVGYRLFLPMLTAEDAQNLAAEIGRKEQQCEQ